MKVRERIFSVRVGGEIYDSLDIDKSESRQRGGPDQELRGGDALDHMHGSAAKPFGSHRISRKERIAPISKKNGYHAFQSLQPPEFGDRNHRSRIVGQKRAAARRILGGPFVRLLRPS
jgi:hypothetical protein